MFDFIRTHQRLMQFLLLLFIFPSFAFFGLEGYTRMSNRDNVVATVAGQNITRQEWEAAHREQMEQFRQMFGAQFNPKMFDTAEARQGILDNLIAKRVLGIEAANNHLSISDQTLQQAVIAAANVVGADGKFDIERYKALLATKGLTPASFEAGLREDLAIQQVNGSIQNTVFVPKTVAKRMSDLNDQQREVQELALKAADFVSKVKVDDALLKDFYEKNAKTFEVPEQVKVEYVVLNVEAIAPQMTVTDADIKSYYEQNVKHYTVEEQRRASHILITSGKDASNAEKAAAKAKAEKLLAQLRKNPADFAKLAKENSQDPGSAERGGDLDFFGKGMMVKAFEETAYKLKQGEISDVVQSEFGYHIIRLTGIKPGSVKSFDEVKGELAAEAKKQMAAKKYGELAEIFSNLVYEQADSLKPVADKLKLKIETVPNLSREPDSAAAKAPFNNPKFLKILFTDDVIKNKHNTEAVEVAPNTLIAGRVVEYKPATKKPFEEVKATVQQGAVQLEAAKLAKAAGEAKLAALKDKDDTAGFAESKTVARGKTEGLPAPAFDAVMKADATKLPAYVGVELPQGYNVYRINKVVQPATTDAARRQTEQQQIASVQAQQETAAYIDALKKKAKVEILKPAVKDSGSTAPETK
jgi:peptidyl-prolyl cis-trans isomerase D